MKLTKQQLRQIIKEELTSTTRESLTDPWTATPATNPVDDILNQAVEAASSGNHGDVVQLLGRAWMKAVDAGDEQAREAVNQMTAEINQKWPEVFGEGLLEEMGDSPKGITAQDIKKAPAMAELLKQSPEIMDAIEQAAKDPKVQAAVEQALAQADGLEEAAFSAERRSMSNPHVSDPSWSPTSRAARSFDKDDISAREVGRSIRQANDPERQRKANLRAKADLQDVGAYAAGGVGLVGIAASLAPGALVGIGAVLAPAMIGLGIVDGPILAGAALLVAMKLSMASDANKRAGGLRNTPSGWVDDTE